MPSTNPPIHQSTNPLVNQSTSQPVNQPTSQPIYRLISIISVSVQVILGGCSTPSPSPLHINGYTMGTTYQVTISGTSMDIAAVQTSIDSLLEMINLSMSTYIDSSLISRINASQDTSTRFTLDRHFIEVFEHSQAVHEATNGAFNPAVAPLIDAWGFGNEDPQELSDNEVAELLDQVDFSAFEILPGGLLRKTNLKSQLNFSAIAKGYGVDALGLWLETQGIHNYFVEIGGDVRTRGQNPEGLAWRIGIDKPEPAPVEQRTLQVVVQLGDVGMATSGNYRNYYERDGKKYVHTINPDTGYPEISNLLSVSVIAEDCMTADAFATAFMVLGVDQARDIVEKDPSLEALFIVADSSGEMVEIETTGWGKDYR